MAMFNSCLYVYQKVYLMIFIQIYYVLLQDVPMFQQISESLFFVDG